MSSEPLPLVVALLPVVVRLLVLPAADTPPPSILLLVLPAPDTPPTWYVLKCGCDGQI